MPSSLASKGESNEVTTKNHEEKDENAADLVLRWKVESIFVVLIKSRDYHGIPWQIFFVLRRD